jgi:meiotically up-regulated gene 157 (Mug157) protein
MDDPLFEKEFVAATYDESKSTLFGISLDSLTSEEKQIILENQKYYHEYDEMMKQEGNHYDARNLYSRSWIQTMNLILGSVVIGVLIYQQK